jgi:hypothetical protein
MFLGIANLFCLIRIWSLMIGAVWSLEFGYWNFFDEPIEYA